jgi:hypothetical protein
MLLVIHYLQCAVQPPVLPSLQALYPHVFTNQRAPNELWLNEQMNLPLVDWAAGRWDVDGVGLEIDAAPNTMSVGELLVGFFAYYARTFDWRAHAPSIRHACVIRR